MDRGDNASSCSVRRSRRPQTRLDTSCTRTGRPRRHLRSKRIAGRWEKARAVRPACTSTRSHTAVPMNHSNKDGTSSAESEEGRLRIEENTLPSGTYPTQSGIARVSWVGECADKRYVGRYLSEIRTGCANERPSGSVREATSDGCPYRDRQLTC